MKKNEMKKCIKLDNVQPNLMFYVLTKLFRSELEPNWKISINTSSFIKKGTISAHCQRQSFLFQKKTSSAD